MSSIACRGPLEADIERVHLTIFIQQPPRLGNILRIGDHDAANLDERLPVPGRRAAGFRSARPSCRSRSTVSPIFDSIAGNCSRASEADLPKKAAVCWSSSGGATADRGQRPGNGFDDALVEHGVLIQRMVTSSTLHAACNPQPKSDEAAFLKIYQDDARRIVCAASALTRSSISCIRARSCWSRIPAPVRPVHLDVHPFRNLLRLSLRAQVIHPRATSR